MKAFHNEVRDRSGIPCEGNCPYLVVTDTLNCRKDSEGIVDMEEVRDTGECPFWPHQEREIGASRDGIEPIINKADGSISVGKIEPFLLAEHPRSFIKD